MRSLIKYSLALLALAVGFSSCTKKDNPNGTTTTSDTGKVYMEFFNVVGSSNLSLNDQWYVNENGDSFTVSKLNYYISNVKLTGAGGTADYAETESYHLIEHSTAAQMAFNMGDVPAGKYSSVTFLIGVDSLRNVSGAQTGALDPALGNFWAWNTGYIMLKFEGKSPVSPNADSFLMYHCGGFSGENSVLHTVTLTFPDVIEVSKSKTPHIHLQADVLKMFKSPNVIDFSAVGTIHMPGAMAKKLSDNYANMFSLTYAGL